MKTERWICESCGDGDFCMVVGIGDVPRPGRCMYKPEEDAADQSSWKRDKAVPRDAETKQ